MSRRMRGKKREVFSCHMGKRKKKKTSEQGRTLRRRKIKEKRSPFPLEKKKENFRGGKQKKVL